MSSAQSVCNTFLKMAFDENIPVTPMKLQKLVYFAYRDCLVQHNVRLFREDFQVWQYGPVLCSVYDEFKAFHGSPINCFAKDAQGLVYVISEKSNCEIFNTLKNVWNKYKGYTGLELSQITHQPSSAWSLAQNAKRNVILDEDIKGDNCG